MNNTNILLQAWRWSIRPIIRRIKPLCSCACILFGIGLAFSAHAAEGTSFKMYDSYQAFDQGTLTGTDFQMRNATEQDVPLTGESFVLYETPPITEESSSSSSSSSTSGEEDQEPDHGGRRGHGTLYPQGQASSGTSEKPAAPSAPSQEPKDPSVSDFGKQIQIVIEPTLQKSIKSSMQLFEVIDSVRLKPIQIYQTEIQGTPIEVAVSNILPWIIAIVALILALLEHMRLRKIKQTVSKKRKGQKRKPVKKKVKKRKTSTHLSCLLLLASASFGIATLTEASTTVPLKNIYQGHLFDSSSNAITTAHTVRFSYWNSTDYVSTDITATGAINTGASTYVGWQEEHTVTPDSNGFFQVHLGDTTSLPAFDSLSTSTLLDMFLQVEVKASAAADTSYDLLDYDTSDETSDRLSILSVPFAQNADLLDQRDVGTGSGSIPLLETGGLLPVSTIPGGTNADTFTLDSDNSTGGTITLQFGETLSKQLSYDQGDGRFEFNDDVYINGDLTTSGLINGVDLSTLTSSSDSHLLVSSGAGLTFNVAAGGYRISGTTTNYAGDSGIALTDDATNYVFFSSGGLVVNTSGFTASGSIVRLAEVVTVGGAVSTVTDRRVTQNDDREHSIQSTYHAEYEHATYQGDATNNIGRLYVSSDSIAKRNFYIWTSSSISLQDYDVILHISLPTDFLRWSPQPLSVMYRSLSSDSDTNQLDISLVDTNGSPVSLSGSSLNLANTSWQTSDIEYTGSPTWTAGQDFLVNLKLHAKDDAQMHIADIHLNYTTLE